MQVLSISSADLFEVMFVAIMLLLLVFLGVRVAWSEANAPRDQRDVQAIIVSSVFVVVAFVAAAVLAACLLIEIPVVIKM